MSDIKKILIISLKAGGGHLKAAQALEKTFTQNLPNIFVKHIDMLDYASVLSEEFYGNWYLDIVNKVPKFYQWLYQNISPASTDLRILSDRLNDKRFKYFIEDFAPDIIICTHFVPANLATFWRQKYHHKYKVIVTLTDYEAHPLWYDPNVDLYTVATPDVKKQMISYGAKQNKIIVTGIPIDMKFSEKFNIPKIRHKYNMKNIFTVSVFAGGFGVGHIDEIIKKIDTIPNVFQIIAVSGKNKILFSKLHDFKKHSHHSTAIFEFTDHIEELMAISDIIVSKPGGLTVSETLSIGVPLIINNPIPGQEEANAQYLLNSKSALRADTPDEIKRILQMTLEYSCIIKQLKYSTKSISKPRSSFDILKISKRFL